MNKKKQKWMPEWAYTIGLSYDEWQSFEKWKKNPVGVKE